MWVAAKAEDDNWEPIAKGGGNDNQICKCFYKFVLCLLNAPKWLASNVGCWSSHSLRATSQTRLRARDRYTSSTFIGGKGGAGPSSLHTPLEGPTEYVNARQM